MEVQRLLNDAGNINNGVIDQKQVPGLANLLKLTSNEIHLGLLHTDIKFSAMVPNLVFKALS
jgi:hypothetical protein